MLIYHIIPEADWRKALELGSYQPESLEAEGFIHLSKQEQVTNTAQRYYAGRSDLMLLQVETEKAVGEVKFENTTGGEELFPHLYSLLNLDAVINVFEFPPNKDGSYSLPEPLKL
jgi:uncharacterized protein (DUF952 family)